MSTVKTFQIVTGMISDSRQKWRLRGFSTYAEFKSKQFAGIESCQARLISEKRVYLPSSVKCCCRLALSPLQREAPEDSHLRNNDSVSLTYTM